MRSRSDKSTPIWCGSDAISEADYESLRGENVTRFIHALSGVGSDLLADAIDTIEQHHPDQTIWVEKVSISSIGSLAWHESPNAGLQRKLSSE